jgi:hypothetical protein
MMGPTPSTCASAQPPGSCSAARTVCRRLESGASDRSPFQGGTSAGFSNSGKRVRSCC